MRVLVFAAHQDDESIGMGGTIYKHAQGGDQVKVVFMTDGSGGSLDIGPKELSGIREEEARNACRLLGVAEVEFLGFMDGFLTYGYDTLVRTGQVIRSYKPDRVYAHHGDGSMGQDNFDHITTSNLVRQAVFKVQYRNYPQFGKEVWKTPEFYEYEVLHPLHDPNAFVDITDVVEMKKKAIGRHRSQMTSQPYWETIGVALNRWRGILTGLGEYVEAFKAVRTRVL